MSSTAAPFGLRPVFHPSGEIRMRRMPNSIPSAYATAMYSGTPVKLDSSGYVIPVGTGAENTIGVFAGCFFISNNRPFLLPYWPAAQTYDSNTEMWVDITPFDGSAEYEAQLNATAAATIIGEGINLANTSQGSIYTGSSTQALDAATTAATPGTFTVTGLAPYADNAWGDSYPIIRVKATIQPAV
jgi:hypothetical protein